MSRLELVFGIVGLGSVTGAMREVELGLARTAKEAKQTARDWKHLSDTLQKTGLALTAVGGVLLGVAALVARAAMQEEASIARLSSSLQAMGLEWSKIGVQTEQYVAAMQRATGFADGQLRPALARAIQITRDYEASLAAVSMAANVARATGMDLESATLLVSKALVGNTAALQRQGIAIREGASATEVMIELQKRFGGATEAYMKTAAGATDRFRNAVGDLQEEFGKHLLPVLADVATALARFVERMQTLAPETQRAIVWGTVLAGAMAAVVGPTLILVANLPRLAAGFAMVQATVIPLVAALAPLAAGLAVVGAAIAGISREAAVRQQLLDAAKAKIITDELSKRALLGESAARKVALALIADHEQATRKQGKAQDDLTDKLHNFSVAGVKSIKAVKEAARTAADFFKGLPIEAQQAWVNMASRWEAAAKSLYGSLSVVREGLGQVEEQAQKTLRSFENLRTHWDDLNDVGTLFGPLVEGVAETLKAPLADALEIVTALQAHATRFGLSFAEALAEIGKRAAEAGLSVLEFTRHLQAVPERPGFMEWIRQLPSEIHEARSSLLALAEGIQLTLGIGLAEAFRVVEAAMARAAQAGISFAEALKQVTSGALERLTQVAEKLRQAFLSAFETLFLDVLTQAKSFGEAITGFFRSIANAILSMIAKAFAQKIFTQFLLPFLTPLFGIFGLAQGGIVRGGLTPLRALQGGGIITRPTLAVVGEGGQDEMVLNKRQAREFIGEPQGEGREIVVKVVNVFDRSQIPRPDPDEITMIMVNDLRTGGPVERMIRAKMRR